MFRNLSEWGGDFIAKFLDTIPCGPLLLFSSMLDSRVVIGRCQRFLFGNFRRHSTASAPPMDVFVSANRSKFYRTLGFFCLAQGTGWIGFAAYIYTKHTERVNWQALKSEFIESYQRFADFFDSTKSITLP